KPGWIEWIAIPVYLLSVLLLGLTLVIGTGSGTAAGMEGWIDVGPIRFQPAELAKLAAVLGLARLLAARDEPPASLRDLLGLSILVAVPLGLVLLQPDLGTALAFVGMLFASLFWAGTPPLVLFLLASPGIALLLSFDTRVWSIYFVGLVVFLYLYRYRLYL